MSPSQQPVLPSDWCLLSGSNLVLAPKEAAWGIALPG